MPPFPQVSPPQTSGLLTRIRLCLALLMAGLLLKGLAGFPLLRESQALLDLLAHFGAGTPLFDWILRVHLALAATATTAPFLALSTDTLALANILFALLFLGPYRDPLRNRWVINFGLLTCVGMLLLIVIAGPLRGIPLFWRYLDASITLLYTLPLLLCRHYLHLLDHIDSTAQRQRTRKLRNQRTRKIARARRPLP